VAFVQVSYNHTWLVLLPFLLKAVFMFFALQKDKPPFFEVCEKGSLSFVFINVEENSLKWVHFKIQHLFLKQKRNSHIFKAFVFGLSYFS